MTDEGYLDTNTKYWSEGYLAPNVESSIFRFYGRVLKGRLGISGEGARLVDFGCGQGATVNFFHKHGFDTYGCDISPSDLQIARNSYPHITDRFTQCSPDPSKNQYYGAANGVNVVTANQTLYYLSPSDLGICLGKLHDAMEPGGIIFATMMGMQNTNFYDNSEPSGNGMRRVNFGEGRFAGKVHFINFIEDLDHLKSTFHMFEPYSIGHYSMMLLDDEDTGFHWVFIGRKR
jgi:SAM-dependent methyltransferase